MEDLITKKLILFRSTCLSKPLSLSDEVSKAWYSHFWRDLYVNFKDLVPEKRSFHSVWDKTCHKSELFVGRDIVDQMYGNIKENPTNDDIAKVSKKWWYQKMVHLLGVKYANKMILSGEDDDMKDAFVDMVSETMDKFRGNVGEQLIEFFSKKNLFSPWYGSYVPLVDDIYEIYIDGRAETNLGTPIGIQIKNYSFKGVKFQTFTNVWARVTSDPEYKCGDINEFKKTTHGIVISINSDGYFGSDTQKDVSKYYGNAIEFIGQKEIEKVLTPSNQHKLEMFEELSKIFE